MGAVGTPTSPIPEPASGPVLNLEPAELRLPQVAQSGGHTRFRERARPRRDLGERPPLAVPHQVEDERRV